jgi:hypothetical protein
MKKALIDAQTLRVVQVEDQEFEVHTGMYWVDCPDETGTYYLYNPEELTFEDPHAHTKDEFGNPTEPWSMQRVRAYPPTGEQLDMLFKELKATGTISTDGAWFKAIQSVKDNLPKPIDESVIISHVDNEGDIVDFYEEVPASRTSGRGKRGLLKFRKTKTMIQVAVTTAGDGYTVDDTITIPGSDIEEASDLEVRVSEITEIGGIKKVVIA